MNEQLFYKNSILTAIPAVHNQAVFADRVNNLCSVKENKPEAIVVELGPEITSEIVLWLKELYKRLKKNKPFPIMLGLLSENRLIHPTYCERAKLLQHYSGERFKNLSHDLIHNLLNYSGQTLLCLSPTDSIIEAIRCGIELNIPVFGIDMEYFAKGEINEILYENPHNAGSNFENYIHRNEKITTFIRDPYIDGRREQVMASRIKTVLGQFKHVLYTGGLAHWEKLKALLSDETVKPTEIPTEYDHTNYNRVIVHPGLAVSFTDTFPIVSTQYEKSRHPAGSKSNRIQNIPDYNTIYRQILKNTWQIWLDKTIPKKHGQTHITEFENLLANFSLLNRKQYPDWSDMLVVAQTMMSEDFCRILENELMDIGQPWASPKEFPNYPVLEPASKRQDNNSDIQEKVKLINTSPDDQKKGSDSYPSGPFYIQKAKSETKIIQQLNFWKWKDKPPAKKMMSYYSSWIWPPCESRLYGTAFQAAKMISSNKSESNKAVFEGSLYNGIDIKASIRSIIMGEKKLYIRIPSLKKEFIEPDGKKPDPTVFIFSETITENKGNWNLFMGGSTIRSYVRDPLKYDRIANLFGNSFITSVAFDSNLPVPQELKSHVSSYSLIHGTAIFGNPCINAAQSAQWIEDNDYRCCPILNEISFKLLLKKYEEWFHVLISTEDWHNALIRFAIPYTKERLAIIAPDNFKPCMIAQKEAKARKITLEIVPLSWFSVERINSIRKRYSVSTNDVNGFNFDPEAEKILGESADNNLELLPLYVQKQWKRR